MPTGRRQLGLSVGTLESFGDVEVVLGAAFETLNQAYRFQYGDVEVGEYTVATTTVNMTAGAHRVILADGSSNTVTVTLPPAGKTRAIRYHVKALDITNAVKVETPGAETIDGAADYTFAAQYNFITLISDGANWWII